jgi:hypothetical protein
MAVLPRVAGDYGFYGFFDIRDPQALLKKLQYDYKRICADPLNAFPVWDFFVTANHLVDWIWPSAGSTQHRAERAAETIPRICEHLANGAKHYIINREHVAVAQIERTGEVFAGYRSERVANGDALVISLDALEAAELGTSSITAQDLARQVLIYWGRRMGSGDAPSID